MTVIDLFAQLAEELRRDSTVTVELMPFPSGAAMLDIRWNDRLFVLDYAPIRGGFGVDEVPDDDALGYNYRFGYKDFESAKQQLLHLLQEAGVRFAKPAEIRR